MSPSPHNRRSRGGGNPSPAVFVTMGPSPHNRRSREEPAPYSDTGREPIPRSVRHHGRRKSPQPSSPRSREPIPGTVRHHGPKSPRPSFPRTREPIPGTVRHHGRRKPHSRRSREVGNPSPAWWIRVSEASPPTVVPEKSLPRTPIRGGNPSPQGSLPCTLQAARHAIWRNEAVNLGE